MKKLLITGASGFLGWTLCSKAKLLWEVLGIYFSHPVKMPGCEMVYCDLQDYSEVKRIFNEVKPDAVIHTAAVSKPDFCEKHSEISYSVNVRATVNIAGLCSDMGIPFVYTSTDLVFDGKNAPYSESSEVSPVSIYGNHKLEAEEKIMTIYPEAAICRMPLMFGNPSPSSESFIQNIIESLKFNKEIRLFTDEYRTPVSAESAASDLLIAIDRVKGVIHLGGKERISRYEFGIKLAKYSGLDISVIKPVLQKDVPQPAPRPKDVSLDSSRAFTLGYKPLELEEEFGRLECLHI